MTEKQVTGFTCGAFDLLHAGHVLMLKQASQHCDFLIVGLQTDPSIDRKEKNSPSQSIYERFVQLSAIRYVDQIIPYDTEDSLMEILNSTQIDIRFVGEEYKSKKFTGQDLPIKIFFTDRKHSFSSSELRKRVTIS
tara:strand:+ start:234 stop:641 length:408 start_codon:yes stop_codon:yes gene_type:complete